MSEEGGAVMSDFVHIPDHPGYSVSPQGEFAWEKKYE